MSPPPFSITASTLQRSEAPMQLAKTGDMKFDPKADASAFSKVRAKVILKAITAGYEMTNKAIAKTSKDNATYKSFIDAGTADPGGVDGRVTKVKTGLGQIKTYLEERETTFSKYALDDGERDETYAYVQPADGKDEIFVGGAFWGAKLDGIDSQGGTVVHELTHLLLGTSDHTYGISDSRDNALNDPDTAVDNADNWEHFAESS